MNQFKRITAIIMIAAVATAFAGCGAKTDITVSPSPTPTVTTPSEPVNIDSAIVGQWVPIGAQGTGYLQFTADGTMVQYKEQEGSEPVIKEQRYYLTGDNTFRMIHNSGNESSDYEFEVVNDGNTLNIYDPSDKLHMASEFQRID